MRFVRLLVITTLALIGSVAEAVTITSVTPSSGPTSGGTQVTIRGTEFGSCPNCSPALPPFVSFGNSAPVMSQFIDPTTLVVTAPPYVAGTVAVRVEQWDGTAELPAAFTYVGDFPQNEFERILVPLLTPPVFGGFGSEFHTDLRIEHRYSPGGRQVMVYGLAPVCPPILCIPFDTNLGLGVSSESPLTSADIEANGSPGRFIYVNETQLASLSMNLRVHDVSRADVNFGTEIPIVRERDFLDPREPIVLLGVPTDARFRNTLRIYGKHGDEATIAIEGQAPQTVMLQGGTNPFEPAYASFGNFPTGTTPVRVTISLTGNDISYSQKKPFWAFISVTNNETQMITTITPRP